MSKDVRSDRKCDGSHNALPGAERNGEKIMPSGIVIPQEFV